MCFFVNTLKLKVITWKKISFVGLLILLIGGTFGCRKNRLEPKSNDSGYAYFPFSIGNTWMYQVDSINFDAFNASSDTFRFFVKHVVTDTIRDINGVKNGVVSSFRSDSLNGNFVFERNFTKRIVNYRAETTDSNIRVVNLLFPPSLFKYWDANAFNTKPEEEYEITDFRRNEVIGGEAYDSTVHVLQRDDDFKTLRKYGIEKYVKHVGLVYSHQIHWTKTTIDPSEIPDGFDYTYTLLKFEE